MASGQMTLGCSWEGDLYAWGHIGGRDEFVPVQYAVECGRYRDLLCHGMTIDTGRMVSAGGLQHFKYSSVLHVIDRLKHVHPCEKVIGMFFSESILIEIVRYQYSVFGMY